MAMHGERGPEGQALERLCWPCTVREALMAMRKRGLDGHAPQ